MNSKGKTNNSNTTISLYWKCQLIGWSIVSIYWAYTVYTRDNYGVFYTLSSKATVSKVDLTVDFKDRKSMSNTEYYPWPLEREKINLNDSLLFKSDVLEEDVIINGSFLGDLEFTINKKDVDFSVILYQLTREGKYFHLSYYIGRASYAKNREKRMLLKQNQINRTFKFI
ncbi:MAG: hypothetical protein JXR05_11120 [Flavobacteriaceae bacterium]